MKKNFKWLLSILIAVFAVGMIGNTAFAEESEIDFSNIEDGKYEATIISLETGSDEKSAADNFINNNATLIIQDGNAELVLGVVKAGEGDGQFGGMDFTIEWVEVDGNPAKSDSDGGDITNYTFELEGLKEITPAAMEYVVPGVFDDGHKVDFDIKITDLEELPEEEEPEEENGDATANDDEENGNDTTNGDEENGDDNGEDNGEGTTNGAEDNGDNDSGVTDGEQEENPQTGDNSSILLYSLLLVGALIPLAIIVTRRFAQSK